MDMSQTQSLDHAIFDILKLLVDTEADITLEEFKRSIIIPLQHGNGHLHYSSDNVLLWFLTWVAVTDEELSYIKENKDFKVFTTEMLDRETSDNCFVLMGSIRNNTLMRDRSELNKVLRRVAKKKNIAAQRKLNGNIEYRSARVS